MFFILLKQYFDESVRNFWNASLSQIYPTLNQMKEEGLLTLEFKYQDSSPNAKIYHITEQGRAELLRWLAEPMEPQPHRSAFLIKFFLAPTLIKKKFSYSSGNVCNERNRNLRTGAK